MAVKELVSRVNEAAAALPRWAEFETQLFTPAAAAEAGEQQRKRRQLQGQMSVLGSRPQPGHRAAAAGEET